MKEQEANKPSMASKASKSADKAKMYAYLRKKYGYKFKNPLKPKQEPQEPQEQQDKQDKQDKKDKQEEKKEKKPMQVSKYAPSALSGIINEKKAQEQPIKPEVPNYPSNADLRRMYDIVQADARLTNKLSGLGFGESGDAYRHAALKLHILELMNVLRSGKNIRNSIVHKPGYIPSESSAKRTLQEYANADKALTAYLNRQLAPSTNTP